MGRKETSSQKWYVYTGQGRIRTEDGVRTNIEGDDDLARPFMASDGWLRRHNPINHRLILKAEYEAKKVEEKAAKPEPKPEPEVLMKDFDAPGADFKKPKPKPKRKRAKKNADPKQEA